ncbi:MAG: EamA/RhaT family transporter [Legionella sp.]|nr:MAG: EamA/RhaT family transporter [Legionella sp.]
MTISAENRGSFYAILSGFLYGFIGYFGISAINGNLSASNMLFWRFLIASIAILLYVLPQIRKCKDSYQSLWMAFLTGTLFYGVSTMIYFYSSLYIGSGLAMVIFFTYPVIIMLLNYFLYQQHIPKVYYLATLIILIGMTLLVNFDKMAFDLIGIFLAIASAFFYACYMISSKRNVISPNMSTLMVCLGCMFTAFWVAILTHSFAVPTSTSVWLNLMGIAIVATVIPILLLLYSLEYISSEKASILSVLEPVFVVIFGVLLLGEELQRWSPLGIALVLTGAVMTLFSHKLSLPGLKTQMFRLLGRVESNQ